MLLNPAARRFATQLARVGFAGLLACAGSAAGAQPAPAERVVVEYVAPTDPAHTRFHDLIKDNRGLERVRDVLLPVRWPRTLRIELKSCGEANAWYEDGAVTVCYEYLEQMWNSANAAGRPAAISRDDAFVGPFVDTVLHEAGHALFDLLKIPLFGREEDAADQVAAYYVLQLPKELKRRLILGAAYAYLEGMKVRRARDLTRPRLRITRHVWSADEHGSGAQRLYNLMCVAYGADPELFADVVEKGFLPQERVELCPDEYGQVAYAYRMLIGPHVDGAR